MLCSTEVVFLQPPAGPKQVIQILGKCMHPNKEAERLQGFITKAGVMMGFVFTPAGINTQVFISCG